MESADVALEKRRHRFIQLEEQCMGPEESAQRVLETIRTFGVAFNESELRAGTASIRFTDPKGKVHDLQFAQLVQETRRTGIVPELDRARWRGADPHGTVFLATNASMPLCIGTGPRTSPPMNGPGLLTNAVVPEALVDILVYRREVARCSALDEDSFKPCFRAYRSYLASCITVLDAYMNRRAWVAHNDPARKWAKADRKVLQNQYLRLDEKFDKWIPLLAPKKLINKTTPAWHAYQSIRKARNGYVHVNEPDYVFSLRQVVDMVNLCREGVGQLLLDVEGVLGYAPHPEILAVRYAPEASFVPCPPALQAGVDTSLPAPAVPRGFMSVVTGHSAT